MFADSSRKSWILLRILAPFACVTLMVGIFAVVSHAAPASTSSGPIVSVTGGKVRGELLPYPGVAVFKGIPYAAPLSGELRWRVPQPVKAWNGVRPADAYGPDCPSFSYEPPAGQPLPWAASHPPVLVNSAQKRTTSEDCLSLNLWTPDWHVKDKKAVIIYVHGGEFVGGTGALPEGPAPNAPSSLARHGVILVTINYRANLLGLMAHPELTSESPNHASGNYAILDVIAALKWVHQNIAHFGGNPDNVTLMGQSGGSRIVSFITTSPLAKGLVKRAILESGPIAQYNRGEIPGLHELEKSGELTAKLLKTPAGDPIKYLRSLPASDIVETARKGRAMPGNANFYEEGIDGYVIPESPAEVYRSHREAAIPILMGNTAQDSNRIAGVPPLGSKASPEEIHSWIEKALTVFYGKYPDLKERAEAYYFGHASAEDTKPAEAFGPIQQVLGTDLDQRCAVVATALWHSTIAPTYVYEFARVSPGYPAVHAAELRAVFGYSSPEEIADGTGPKLDDQMQQYWANFARTGDPNGPGLPDWPKYETITKKSIEFTNDGPVLKTGSHAAACSPYLDKLARLPPPLYGGAEAVAH